MKHPLHRYTVGAWVQSSYRNPWRGTIEDIDPESRGRLLLVRPRLSKSNQPCTGAKARWLHRVWLAPIDPPEGETDARLRT